jgi:hypothetical protein
MYNNQTCHLDPSIVLVYLYLTFHVSTNCALLCA